MDTRGATGDPRVNAGTLAKILNERFGTAITGDQVLDLFRSKWSSVSLLAHAIHNGLQAEGATNQSLRSIGGL